jgi:hypothetical protein
MVTRPIHVTLHVGRVQAEWCVDGYLPDRAPDASDDWPIFSNPLSVQRRGQTLTPRSAPRRETRHQSRRAINLVILTWRSIKELLRSPLFNNPLPMEDFP